MPTLPFEKGCFESQSMTASPSRCSISLYSYGMTRPSLLPVPRMSTRATTYPRCTK